MSFLSFQLYLLLYVIGTQQQLSVLCFTQINLWQWDSDINKSHCGLVAPYGNTNRGYPAKRALSAMHKHGG